MAARPGRDRSRGIDRADDRVRVAACHAVGRDLGAGTEIRRGEGGDLALGRRLGGRWRCRRGERRQRADRLRRVVRDLRQGHVETQRGGQAGRRLGEGQHVGEDSKERGRARAHRNAVRRRGGQGRGERRLDGRTERLEPGPEARGETAAREAPIRPFERGHGRGDRTDRRRGRDGIERRGENQGTQCGQAARQSFEIRRQAGDGADTRVGRRAGGPDRSGRLAGRRGRGGHRRRETRRDRDDHEQETGQAGSDGHRGPCSVARVVSSARVAGAGHLVRRGVRSGERSGRRPRFSSRCAVPGRTGGARTARRSRAGSGACGRRLRRGR